MFYIAVTVFPVFAIVSGIVSLVSVVRFVAGIYSDIRKQAK
jgi:hypothetical protein